MNRMKKQNERLSQRKKYVFQYSDIYHIKARNIYTYAFHDTEGWG